MSAKKRSRRARAVPAPQAAAMAHARWVVERVRGVIGRLRALRRAAPAASAKTRAAGEDAAASPSKRAAGGARPALGSSGERRGGAMSAARTRLQRGGAALRAGARRLLRALGPLWTRGWRASAAGMVGLMRLLVRERAALLGLSHRLLWWGSLALFVIGGRIVADPHSGGTLAEALPLFIGGFGLCAGAALLAASARIRWASLALGAGHAGLALLLWAVNA